MTDRVNSIVMWLLLASLAAGGVFVIAGWVLPGVVLLALPVVAVWRLDR